MDPVEIRRFALDHLEPLGKGDDRIFRCAATLTDGLHLPCVVLAGEDARLRLARRRLQETEFRWRVPFLSKRAASMEDPYVLRVFVVAGNRLNDYDIASLAPSPFALPAARMAEIRGETSMSWTQFVGVMRDGSEHTFGTTYSMEFFAMPEGYSAADVALIRPAERMSPRATGTVFRERPFFTCFLAGL